MVIRTKTDEGKELDLSYEDMLNNMLDLLECEKDQFYCFMSNYEENYTFDEFVKLFKFVKRVKFDDTNWKLSSCSCSIYIKLYISKHIINGAY